MNTAVMRSLPEALLEQAVEHHRSGRFSDAGSFCRPVLSLAPARPAAFHHPGLLGFQTGHLAPAQELRDRGRPRMAIDRCRASLLARPDCAEAFSNHLFAMSGDPDATAAETRARILVRMPGSRLLARAPDDADLRQRLAAIPEVA